MRLRFSCILEIGTLYGRTEFARAYGWVNTVRTGVDRLCTDRLLPGGVLRLQDSWSGLCRVQEQ